MTLRRETLRQIASLCDEIGPEDGIDPRLAGRDSSENAKKNTNKNAQLCRQAEIAIRLALGEMDDEDLVGLNVAGVETGSTAGSLVVLVGPADESSNVDEFVAIPALARVAGVLRGVVASTVRRKRAPMLVFRFVPLAGGEE